MILVIADDLTGASEIGGIALRFNLTVDIVQKFEEQNLADVQIINTNSRSLSINEALKRIKSVCESIKTDDLDFIYLKIDSALRGHVITDVLEVANKFNYSKIVILPANPSLGRIIKDGEYYINGQLINETSFAKDPEFPIISSNVLEILNAPEQSINVLAPNDVLPHNGISIVGAETIEDVSNIAKKVSSGTLLVGGSDFFTALLKVKYTQYIKAFREHVDIKYPVLYVCGSAHQKSLAYINSAKENGFLVNEILVNDKESNLTEIKTNVLDQLKSKNYAILAIHEATKTSANSLREDMSSVVAEIVKDFELSELVIEGGATANSILEKLEINKLSAVQEIAAGVIKNIDLKNKLLITLKPGSYSWSKELWKF